MVYTPREFFKGRKPDHGFKINEFIRASQVRVVGENITSEVCSINEAIRMANELNLDLVEISPDASPPVCKIVDFQKFLYEKRKKEKESKNSNKTTLKEIKLGPNIGEHDMAFKTKNSIEFLQKGHKVKAFLKFKGREMVHKTKGELILLQFIQALSDYGKPEFLPKMEGTSMFVIITPKKV